MTAFTVVSESESWNLGEVNLDEVNLARDIVNQFTNVNALKALPGEIVPVLRATANSVCRTLF
ncbi:hypothetical protein OHS71_18900 [Streptomyces sp. NBC_00377]|uniref:hypothetical protein n=1 Tax=unclassified Streptomyces TaxID=2593676 RepID=UPI002E1C98C1|nr:MULTISPECIES: hypothetical protein [unclassified Streptomyces]